MAQAEVLPRTQMRTPGRPADPCIMVIFGAAGDFDFGSRAGFLDDPVADGKCPGDSGTEDENAGDEWHAGAIAIACT